MSKSLLYGLTPDGEKQVRHHLSNRANKLAKYLQREVDFLNQHELEVKRSILRKSPFFDDVYYTNINERRQKLIEIIELLKLIKVEIRKTPAIKADDNED